MTVVSNTSPLNYLVQIGAIEILFQLFEYINISTTAWQGRLPWREVSR